ncbi:uncharacterized protein LOC122004449 [Zingiber officinale]|uniref:uncharacterized protein LOC122004449 n=1 Tax=Zingiber officinale TaxID=94328 RepID=UPI001C4C3BA6|nr:uncharacterized protein LOC122004449 [Zingiber officinale]
MNVPLLTMIKQIPKYAKFLKDLCVHKKKLKGNELISMGKNVSALLQPVPQKCEDPGVFIVPYVIGDSIFEDAMLDLGASINVMLKSVFQSLRIGPLQPTDFYILDMEGDVLANRSPLILGRPFLKTARTKIDVHAGTLSKEIGDTAVQFGIFEAMKYPREDHSILSLDISEELDSMDFFSEIDSDSDFTDVGQGNYPNRNAFSSVLENILDMEIDVSSCELFPNESDEVCVGDCLGEALPLESLREEEVCVGDCSAALPLGSPSIDQTQDELKSLPRHFKYAYLGENQQLPFTIAHNLKLEQEDRLLEILRQHKKAIGWTLADILGISPSICMHRINLEEDVKSVRRLQRRLNPLILDVVKKEVTRLLQAGIIYPISDSKWVSPIHMVPKKSGVIVVANEENELVPTRVKNSWRVCVDYRKLNQANRKDHYPLPFIDQMLERLAGKSHYYFLDGYTGYFQICIYPEDQEKTTFTCPFGTFAYRRMPFGLCNAPGTFQRCMFDQSCKEACQKLKEALVSAPIIKPPDWTLPFELMCDASDYGVGAIFAQSYLLCSHVVVFSDHAALMFLLKKPDAKPRLIRWMLLLQEFDLEIRDRSGKENLVANHLSRIEGDLDHTAIDDDFKDE